MQARRARLVAVLAAVLLAALPMGAAHAAGTGRITSPAPGAVLDSPTSLVVQVTGRAGTVVQPRDHAVRLRLADPGGTSAWSGTSAVGATCRTDCHTDSTWTAGSFDPATLAPFGGGPSCNGSHQVQVQVDGGVWSGHAIRITRAPGAPRDVTVTPGVEQATVTWGAAPDPDVAGYRVHRRAGDGAWQAVGELGPDARSLDDADVEAGEVAYRVATLRGDGLVAGAPAAPCTDTEPDLVTASAPVSTTVRPTSSSSPTATPRPSPSTPPDDGDGDDATEGATAPDGGDDGEPDEATDEQAAPVRRPGNRVASPTAVGTGGGPRVDVPDDPDAAEPQVASSRETFYGEGEGFSEQLDFDGLGTVDALGDRARVMRVPGALQGVLGEELALQRILAPVSGGMIMLACGLHLRRWTREGLES